jgi:glycosyltransferase involved in cell wall biosynthesis
MKILIVGITPPELGGSERHIFEIARRLRNNFDVTVLTQKGSACSEFVKTIELELPKSIFLRNFMFMLKTFVYFLSCNNWDIIHIHESYLFLLSPLLRLKCKKLIATVHGCFGFKYYENLLLRKIFFSGLKLADKVVFVAPNELEIFKGELNAVWIPNGVDLSKFYGSKKVTNNVVFWGRFHPQKGIPYLLGAFKIIQNSHPELKLVLIGQKNDYAAKMEELAKAYDLNTEFLGFLPDKELVCRLQKAKLIVLPSLFEGAAIAILEALAVGRPVVTTAIPSNRTILSDGVNSLLVKPADSVALAKAIIKVVENPKLAARLSSAASGIVKSFTWDKAVEKLGSAYLDD